MSLGRSLTAVFFAIYCGQTQTRISQVGAKTIVVFPSRLDLMLFPVFYRSTIWILFAERIKLSKTAMSSFPNDNWSRYSAHPITAENSITQEL